MQLAPGESRRVKFTLTQRDLSYYDPHVKDWIATPGTHRVSVGSSSGDIRASATFQWTAPRDPRLPDAGRATFSDSL